MSHHNPHPCACFGGFCWKNLCAERTINKAYAKATEPETAPACAPTAPAGIKPPKNVQVSVIRDGVSYDTYTMPAGRIPPKR